MNIVDVGANVIIVIWRDRAMDIVRYE